MRKRMGFLTSQALLALGIGLAIGGVLTGRVAKTTLAQAQPALEEKGNFQSALNASDMAELIAGTQGITGIGKPPRVGPNRQVNALQAAFPNGLLGRSETTIAATDPIVNGLFVAAFNDAQGFCGSPFGVACTPQSPPGLSGFAFSTDGGQDWTDGGAPDPALFNNVFTRGDPWLDRGGFDNLTFYFANLAIDATTAASLGASVHRGHFSGSTFAWEDVRVIGPSNPNDFFDKEAITAAKDGSGKVILTLTNFIETCGKAANGFGQIEVFRSTDGGNTYSGPAIAGPDLTFITDPSNPNCGTTGTLQQSSAPAIGPKGEVYVAWQRGPTFNPTLSTDAEIVVARSLDGGATFSSPVVVQKINSMRADAPVGYNRSRLNDHPRIAVATGGTNKGRVYVSFYSAVSPVPAPTPVPCPAGFSSTTVCFPQILVSSQIFVSHSDDLGTTWSTPVALASTPPATGLKRWWPVVTVEPTGTVDVIYYESRETQATSNPTDIECNVGLGGPNRRVGTNSSLVDTFWTFSKDGGITFAAPIRVSNVTSNWCTTVSNIRPNFGDYIGSFSGGSRVFPVWADGRNGVPDTFFATGLSAGKK